MIEDSGKLPILDARLGYAASLIKGCSLVADIGTDHGQLACHLLLTNRTERIIASDISALSREKARALFYAHGVLDRARISQLPGLLALEGEKPQAIMMLGMGGGLIADMLMEAEDLGGARLVLGPQSQLPHLRKSLQNLGYNIEHEQLVRSHGRYYIIISAIPGNMVLGEGDMLVGYNLRGSPQAQLIDYLRWQLDVAKSWHGARGQNYRKYLEEAIDEEQARQG